MQIQAKSQRNTNFGVNIAKLAKTHQPPNLRYSVPAPRGQWVDRSLGRSECHGTRDRVRAALYVAHKVWTQGLWPKDKPLPLSSKKLTEELPAIWKKFIGGKPKDDLNGPHKIGDLLVADLTHWKKNWAALSRSAKIDAKNAELDSIELKENKIHPNQIPSLARSYNTDAKTLTPEFLNKKKEHQLRNEQSFKKDAETLEDTENFTFGDLPAALDKLQIPQGSVRTRTGKIPFAPYKPEWYSDASNELGGPLREG